MSPSFYYFWKKDVPVLLFLPERIPVLYFPGKEVPVLYYFGRMSRLLYFGKGCPRLILRKEKDIERRGLRSSGMLISLFFPASIF